VLAQTTSRAILSKSNTFARLSPTFTHQEVMTVGRPKKYEGKKVTTAVRLPEPIHRRLQEEAEARDLSVNFLIVKATDLLLQRLRPISAIEAELEQG
jgi:predicted HicB family RNase H-like nuclease